MKGINHTGEILYREYLGIVRDLKKNCRNIWETNLYCKYFKVSPP